MHTAPAGAKRPVGSRRTSAACHQRTDAREPKLSRLAAAASAMAPGYPGRPRASARVRLRAGRTPVGARPCFPNRQHALLPAELPGIRAPAALAASGESLQLGQHKRTKGWSGQALEAPLPQRPCGCRASGWPAGAARSLCRGANAVMLAASSACAWQLPRGAVSELGRRCVAGAMGFTPNRQHLEHHSP